MEKRFIAFILVLVIGIFAMINGALLDMGGLHSALLIMGAGMILELVAIVGILVNLTKKFRPH